MIRRDQKMEPGLARRGDDLLDRAVTIVGETRMGMKDASEFGQSFQGRQHQPLAPKGHQGVSYGLKGRFGTVGEGRPEQADAKRHSSLD